MSFAYLDEIRRLLDVVENQEKDNIQKAVDCLTNAILEKKSLFIFGASHAGILAEEVYYRAGGLVLMNPIFARSLMLDTQPVTFTSSMEQLVGYGTTIAETVPFKAGDVLIVHSVSGRNPVGIELAMAAKEKGVTVICLSNVSYSKDVTSRHPSGKRLFEVCDILLDNHGEKGDACIEIPGTGQKVAPTSTAVGVCIMNTIISEVVLNLKAKGMDTPPVFYSANIDGGAEKNKKVIEEFGASVHYRF